MIGWIIGIVTGILLVFFVWQRASKAFRERVEEPKYLFLESLGIRPGVDKRAGQSENSERQTDTGEKR
jgi:hypothetical protein